jgi:hypothetical protein
MMEVEAFLEMLKMKREQMSVGGDDVYVWDGQGIVHQFGDLATLSCVVDPLLAENH